MKEVNIHTTNESHLNSITEVYFKSAFENSFVGMAIIDTDGKIFESNKVFSEIIGFSNGELNGMNLLSFVHQDDMKIHSEAWDNLIHDKISNITLECRYQNKLKETVWVRNSFSVVYDNNSLTKTILIICINIDLEREAQQKAEEVTKRFRFLADSMPQQIWTADAAGNLDYFSHSFYEYSGMAYNDITNGTWTNIIFKEDRKLTCELWKQSVETSEEFVVEHRLRRRDGNYQWHLSRAIAQKDNQGKVILWVGATSNIHRQKTVEEELEKQVIERTHDLQQANFNLKHSNHDLEQFAYIATHDLQEPLRKIRTYSSWINKMYIKGFPEEAGDYMTKIENASERMSVLIDDLLNYSLLLRPQELSEIVDLDMILEDVLKELDPIIRKKNAVIHREHLPQLNVIPKQIYQLFSSLLSNALKFNSNDRELVIQISCRNVSESEILSANLDIDLSYVEIAFKDNGIGFKQEYAKKVFSIFQRLNSRNKYPGTGIGLALCQKIANYHHGHIYATAVENVGASFFIILPIM